jgi:uncharacterized protein (DUF1330 family)
MVKLIVQHHVADYDRWYPIFIEHGAVRQAHGGQGHAVHRGVEDPNNLVIVNSFASAEGARSFMADPSVKQRMAEAGVDSEPQIWLVDEAESQDY